jgi:DNA-directed RNA polymerase specialized sigma24 family protein
MDHALQEQRASELVPRVRTIARFYQKRFPSVDRDEIESAAMYGVALGLRSFDEAKGVLHQHIDRAVHSAIYSSIRTATGYRPHRSSKSDADAKYKRARDIAAPVHLENFDDVTDVQHDDVERYVLDLEAVGAIVRTTEWVEDADLAMLLAVAGGQKSADIAREHGVTQRRVDKRIERARDVLRAMYEELQ